MKLDYGNADFIFVSPNWGRPFRLKMSRGRASARSRGNPNASIEVLASYMKALHRMQVGGEIIIISWLHCARRNVMEVHPRGDASRPLTGVFSTRSPD